MHALSDRRSLLRWIFLAVGLFLIVCHEFVVHSVLRVDTWAELLYPDNPRRYAFLMAMAYLALIPSGLLCLATAWGLKRSRRWSRWAGICACVILLFGFPWFTIVAGVGLFVLVARPPRLGPVEQPGMPASPKRSTDCWSSKRQSFAQTLVSGACMVVAINVLVLGQVYAERRLGLPAWNPGQMWLVYLFSLLLVNTTIHELGHAAVAWALCDRLRAISIGPFTFWNDRYGRQFKFEWKRLLNSDGYMAAVPASDRNPRFRLIATAGGGPAASLLNGLVMLALFLSLPGTRWQAYWGIVAFDSVLGFAYALICLIPVGYTDGSMIFHTLLWTRDGRALLNHILVDRMQEDADADHGRADFEKEVELREAALRQAIEGGEGNAMAIAICYQRLGHAKLSLEDWPGSEAAFQRSVEFGAECMLVPALAANAWSGLEKACAERHHVAGVGPAYVAASAIIEGRKAERGGVTLGVTRLMLAQVHKVAGTFDKALEESREGLKALPAGRDRLMLRAMAYSAQAQCELALGLVESGLASAGHAAEILRSGQIPRERQNLGWDELGGMGEQMDRAGQPALAADLMREAVEHLELNGASTTAVRYRIKLAAVLRHLGRVEEASGWLPEDRALPVVLRRYLLAERARLRLAAAQPNEAVTDSRELVALWQADPAAPAAETAVAQGLLAEASLEAGDYAQAEDLAKQAGDVLRPWRHPDAATYLITGALARWLSTREWTATCTAEALGMIQTDLLLTRASKVRRLEKAAARLDRYGRLDEAQTLRRAAQEGPWMPACMPEPAGAELAVAVC